MKRNTEAPTIKVIWKEDIKVILTHLAYKVSKWHCVNKYLGFQF